MTERERIIEAGAEATYNSHTWNLSIRDWKNLPDDMKKLWRFDVAVVLDAMLPLVLPVEPPFAGLDRPDRQSALRNDPANMGLRDVFWAANDHCDTADYAEALDAVVSAAFAARREELSA